VSDDLEVDDEYTLPISHEVVLTGHQKSIQAIDIDVDGVRMVTGGLDFILKIWDFNGMNRRLQAMKEYRPFEGHPIMALSFDHLGSNFLCCCANNQARVYTRDGGKGVMTIRGDMYIQD
jgi:WD40 repeat protein